MIWQLPGLQRGLVLSLTQVDTAGGIRLRRSFGAIMLLEPATLTKEAMPGTASGLKIGHRKQALGIPRRSILICARRGR